MKRSKHTQNDEEVVDEKTQKKKRETHREKTK